VEQQVSETETDGTDETRPSEARLLKEWTQDEAETYEAFKNEVLAAGLYPQAKKSGMSFLAQTRRGDVFVCFFSASSGQVILWIRNDSMQALIDFDKACEAVTESAPQDFRFARKPTWFMIRLPASAENARRAASLVIAEVVRRVTAE